MEDQRLGKASVRFCDKCIGVSKYDTLSRWIILRLEFMRWKVGYRVIIIPVGTYQLVVRTGIVQEYN